MEIKRRRDGFEKPLLSKISALCSGKQRGNAFLQLSSNLDVRHLRNLWDIIEQAPELKGEVGFRITGREVVSI